MTDTVDGSEIPRPTTWDVQNPAKYWGKLPIYQPQLVSRISSINSMTSLLFFSWDFSELPGMMWKPQVRSSHLGRAKKPVYIPENTTCPLNKGRFQ